MKQHTTLWGLLREIVVGDPVKKQYERVETAIKTKAQKVSDAEFNRTMANFYTDRVLGIDPHQDWWDFADAKQKQYDHQTACVKNDQQVNEAHARVEAEAQRFHALQEKHHA
jgi:7-keto-8-aminopelargonate synthetase-like enzyme